MKGRAAVRDPVSSIFSGVLGSMTSIETTAGSGAFRAGVQGFIPRPRLNARYGLGHIEAFFPRASWLLPLWQADVTSLAHTVI